ATFAKDGESQTIGLNPTGSVAQAKPDEPASSVKVDSLAYAKAAGLFSQANAAQPEFEQLVKQQLGPWDGKSPRLGLSLAETQRHADYLQRGALDPITGRTEAKGPNGFLSPDQVAALGADRADYLALNQKLLDALREVHGTDPPFILIIPPSPGSTDPALSAEQILIGTQAISERKLSDPGVSNSALQNVFAK
ncbi:MAG: hypothetical protein JWM33_3778, partial [Caulobacteraceae bacterium]|nr:hypothetical protein [Caulobacteraceae bacterium]